MSLTAFKNKSVIQYGSKRSGKTPGGVWLPQGPFGKSKSILKKSIQNYGPVGFSINGGHRNVGYIGKTYQNSKSGTPFRGTKPMGWGGTYGNYKTPEPVYNSTEVIVLGDQYQYIKPSVLSTKGMLENKYKWIHNGQYPNYWVQPNYTGNQTDTASQWLYIQNKSAANICKLKVNDVELYEGNIINCGSNLCTPGRSTANFKYNDLARNAPYTKQLYQPVDSSTYTLHIQVGCQNPKGPQKPFPFAVQTGSGQQAAGSSITSFGNACNTSNIYLTPPSWYTGIPSPSSTPSS